MTPLEQHTAIALALGYTFEDKVMIYDGSEIKFRIWNNPDGGGMEKHWPPNYPEDLNAMHEAETALTLDQQVQFSVELGRLTTSYLPASRAAWMDYTIAHATSSQRAEAFLKTLNLWTPTQ